MARKNEHASIEEYTHDLRAELRQVGKQELGGLEAVIQGNGYSWMYEYLENIVENNASGSRLPVTELMKTPSRHTAKKTRTATTAAKDRTNKVNLANSKLLGSPINKSSSSRPPLSPVGGRHLNAASQPIFEKSPTKSPASKPLPAASKPDKGKGKATAKKGRAKKNADGENAAPDIETSASTRSGLSTTASARSDGMLRSKSLAASRQASPAPTPPRPPRSPERAAPPALPERTVEPTPVEEAADDVEEDGAAETARDEAEEMEVVVEKAAPTPSSAPSRPRTVDLSVIAEAEEDRTSVTFPTTADVPPPISQATPLPTSALAAPSAPLPAQAEPIADAAPIEIEQPILSTTTAPTSQPAPSIPARQVRSSWLSKALGGAAPGSTGPQRPSESANRSSIVPGPTRLSTTDYPTMRKSLVQPGILAKRKSGEGIWDEEEEAEKDAEKRPEKIARVEPESTSTTAPVSSGPSKPISATAPPPSAPVVPAEKPPFDRQHSQESFARPTASSALSRSTAPPTSGVDRVSKALDDMRERQQAKDAAKQKAALSVSIAAPASAPARSSGTGAGFLYGLGTSLGRSLGLGGASKDPEEEARRLQQEKEEEEEVRRKAKEDLSEIMKKMEQPDVEEGEDDEMDMEMEEEEAVITVAESRFPAMRVVEQEADELDTDEEAEVNESIEIDEVTSLLGSPVNSGPPPLPAPAPAPASATPARLRNHVQSTTPQGTPPRSIPAAVIGSTRVLRSSPAAAPAQPRAPRQLDGTIASSSTIHDRIKLFNGSSQPAPEPTAAPHATKTPSLFSPTRSGAKRSDAIEVDLDDSPRRGQAMSTDPAEEEEEAEEEEKERPASTISRTTSSASLFGQASTMADKALGVKPTVGQVKSVQLAGSAYKKDLAASERRAQVKEQRIKTIADRKAEEEKKQKERELEEKRLKAAELEKRKKEAEERRAQISKAKAEKAERERKEREAAEKAEAEAEALRKHKLATSQSKAPMQPAKRVISASSSSTNILNGIAKMKEPAKLTKPAGLANSTHGPSKLVPSTFRTAPPPPETPVNQMSHTGSIRLVGQTQPQQQAQAQADRKPLGPPTRPSAIRASNQAQAIRQSAAVAAQHHPSSSSTMPSHTSVLAQSRLALQSQLEAEASEDIVLPDIASEYSDSGDETDDSPAFKRPQWAESPELRAALAAQASKNPDELFGPIRPLLMDELFKAQQKNKFRSRTSSGNWQRDGLKKEEEEEYARRMGFTTGTGKW